MTRDSESRFRSKLFLNFLAIVGIISLCHRDILFAGDLGINLYGLSYHLQRHTDPGESFNEFNPGAGIRYTFFSGGRNSIFAESGIYDDSFRHTAFYVAGGYHFEIVDSLLRLGALVALYKSPTINKSRWTPALIPQLSVRLKDISINLVYVPAFRDVNKIPTLGLYLTLHFFHF